MLKDTLYTIIASNHRDQTILATVELNKDSEIFTGHFPGQPVLPGACMLQIVKEVLVNMLGVSIRITKADQIKFLRLIDPAKDNLLQLSITYRPGTGSEFYVAASLGTIQDNCFKLKGTYITI